jgi:hypothetical protein
MMFRGITDTSIFCAKVCMATSEVTMIPANFGWKSENFSAAHMALELL